MSRNDNLNSPETPHITVCEMLRDLSWSGAQSRYGDKLPEQVKERLGYELGKITEYGFSRHYLIAHEVTKECKKLHIPFLARGCAGASLVAFLLDITHTNPLPPHLYCRKCRHTEFEYKKYFVKNELLAYDEDICGYDLVNAYQHKVLCPECGATLTGDGHGLPFETFAGLNGDKEPRFDIDVPEGYKKKFENYLYALLDNDKQDSEICDTVRIIGNSRISLLSDLQEMTGVPEESIHIDDAEYHEFSCGELNTVDPQLDMMLRYIEDLPICRFSEIVKLLGYMHCTVDWTDTAEELYNKYLYDDEAPIAHREDIMQKLMRHGFEREAAFRIMETVRRGKASKLPLRDIIDMTEKGISDEYIKYMMGIRYLFPRSHDTEHAIVIFKLMWYKQNYPVKFAKSIKIYIYPDIPETI